MNLLILVNPHAAGGQARKLMPRIQSWCEGHGQLPENFKIEMPESIEAGLDLIRRTPEKTRVVLVGGDGTFNQMLSALVQQALTVGLVPYGSGNDCARAWGLHTLSWQEALKFAIEQPASKIDIGSVTLANGRVHYFHSSLAVGFDASVGNRALNGPKFLTGLPRYLLATFRELAHLQNWHMQISIDGELVHQGTSLLASTLNTSTYGGGMPAVPDALMNDGKLNLLMAGQFNRLQTLLMLPRLLIGQHLSHPRIQCQAFVNAEISSPQALPLAADGETLGLTTHCKIQVLPGALKVVRN